MKIFVVDEFSVFGYIFYKLLGYEVVVVFMKMQMLKRFYVLGLFELNYSQIIVIKIVLFIFFSLIQGLLGIGKMVILVIIIYYFVRMNNSQVFVCVFFNVVVDQFCECIYCMGFKVVCLIVKFCEDVELFVSFLVFYEQVCFYKQSSEFINFNKFKVVVGELFFQDEKRFK